MSEATALWGTALPPPSVLFPFFLTPTPPHPHCSLDLQGTRYTPGGQGPQVSWEPGPASGTICHLLHAPDLSAAQSCLDSGPQAWDYFESPVLLKHSSKSVRSESVVLSYILESPGETLKKSRCRPVLRQIT